MLIRTPKDWELRESIATPEKIYRLSHRRDFLKTLGIAGVAFAARDLLGATAGFPTKVNADYRDPALKPTSYDAITSYNNFYEFGTGKDEPKPNSAGWKTEPWTVELSGLVNAPQKIDVNELVGKIGGIEERVYRHRCVEAWSMVIPWDGFALAKLVTLADPKPEAKFLKFTSFNDPKSSPGQRDHNLDYPYVEGLRLDEATNELAFLATGVYGKALPNQNGAPIRLVTPWKYGFKGIKSIVRIRLTHDQPLSTWNLAAPN